METDQLTSNQDSESARIQPQQAGSNRGLFLVVVISILLTAMITGSAVYFWQKSTSEKAIDDLRQEITALKNQMPTSQSASSVPENSIQISPTIPSENDSFSFDNKTNGDSLSITNDILKVEVSYSGGCADHEFTLMWGGMFLESYPVQAELYLIHDGKGDTCEAYIHETLEFDLSPLKKSYNERYQSNEGTVIIYIHGTENKEESITYKF